MIACLRAAQALDGPGQTKMASKVELQLGQLQAINSLRSWIRSASPMRLTKCRMIVSQTFAPETEVSAARQTPAESTQQSLRSLF